MPEGLILALSKMKMGETAEVTVGSKYGYGDVEHMTASGAVVPPDSTLGYQVTRWWRFFVGVYTRRVVWELAFQDDQRLTCPDLLDVRSRV